MIGGGLRLTCTAVQILKLGKPLTVLIPVQYLLLSLLLLLLLLLLLF
jgi:hypothetical protein